MPPLDSAFRRILETKIVAARRAAERAARSALDALAVREREPYPSLGPEDRKLRNQLRARARQLGEGSLEAGYGRLVAECAYEQWHRMLFARFLAENDLLMHPEGVPVTLADCAELAGEEGDPDAWATASRYAARMLPGIFRNEDPVLRVRLFPEGRSTLEIILEEIPPPTFTSDDGLGWVYQFWQTEAKKEVNASERKIGGADLPAVTQLFTEDYMVKFLLHNTLGAWWAARHPDSPINGTLEYLRRLDDGTPAAGDFPGWPRSVAELRVLDPCCGSGHFLTAAADLLARMRAEEEGLDEAEAFEAVLRDNLFGLELDARCTQLAAFALALQAWKRGGYRELPIPNVACSGLAVGGRVEEWTQLANGDARLEETLRRLHALFRNAPDLGSLIDPARVSQNLTLEVVDFRDAEVLLDKAISQERAQDDPTAAVFGEAARGLVRAASLLVGQYHLVATNVPYLASSRQGEILRSHLEQYHPTGKADLATAFVQRCRSYCVPSGTYALVTPQNWLFLSRYKKLRESMLKSQNWEFVSRLGPGAFETISGEVVKAILVAVTENLPTSKHRVAVLDVSYFQTPVEKANGLQESKTRTIVQAEQLEDPDARVNLDLLGVSRSLLSKHAFAVQGLATHDDPRFLRAFWEFGRVPLGWEGRAGTIDITMLYGGRTYLFPWNGGKGQYYEHAMALKKVGRLVLLC